MHLQLKGAEEQKQDVGFFLFIIYVAESLHPAKLMEL